MDAERWQQIEELYHSALALGEDARSAFLDEACSGDETLRREIDSLLQYQDRAEHFIESPAIEIAAALVVRDRLTSMVGKRIGPYEIESLIATGGMGEVYQAADTRLGRRVALKLLMKESTRDRARVRRFEQEARAASALNHPNILTVYDISEVDGTQCIVTEFIEGQTLRQQMIAGRMNVKDATDVATQVASALAAAHDAGIVHRDIKPENIMVRRDGYVKVLDFGLAKLARPHAFFKSGKQVSTDEGIVMGTVNYMSPEQARGQLVDVRSDIFSFGCVLYEMVSGRAPFEGETSADVIAAILEKSPPELELFTYDVPDLLEGIIDRALRKDRRERFQTAEELLAELKSLKQRLEFEDELQRSMSGSRLIQIATLKAATTSEGLGSGTPARQSNKVIDSLAILPFGNLPAETELEYFSDGITESIINTLSRIPELRVMAWSTVCAYKDRIVDPRDAGRDLGVRGVVTGRLIQQGNQFVLKIELVDAADGSQVWSEACVCKPSDVLQLEAGICKEISEKLLVRLSSEERGKLSRRYTENTDAYHAYLKGRYFWNKRTDEGVRQGIEYFKEAIDIDPGYALAYAGLADSYLILGSFGIATMEPAEAFPKAREAARRALEFDDELAEAHASLATSLASYYWDWPAAEREFKRSIELKPGYATAHHWYGFIYLASIGRLDEAISEIKRAHELDPLSITISSDTGLIYYLARQNDLAIDAHRKTCELDKNFVYSYWKLGLAYEQKGMYDEAIEEFQKAIALSGRSLLANAQLGHAYAVSGQLDKARVVLEQLEKLSNEKYVSPARVAAIHAALGEKDRAFEWLERAFAIRDGWLIWLKVDPIFDGLRSDTRFEKLVRKVGLGAGASTAATVLRGATVLEPIGHTVLKGLAVLPFNPISAGHSDEYLELGIADALITKLSNVTRIVVRPTSSVRKYTGSDQDASQVGRELRVESVLEGCIQKMGDRIRVTAQLVRVEDGRSLWAGQFDEQFTDIFAVEDAISERVAAALALKLTSEERERVTKHHTENVEAYQAYLKGRFFWNKRTTHWLKKGIEHFQQAIEIDKGYAVAHAGLADSYTLLVTWEALRPEEGFSKAKQAAGRALEIDPALAEAHAGLGHTLLHTWEWEASAREFRRAIELNSGYAPAHQWYSEYLAAVGAFDESVAEMERALDLDPVSVNMNADVARMLYFAGRYDEATEQIRRTIEMEPEFWLPHHLLGQIYTQTRMYKEAIAAFETAMELSGKGPLSGILIGHAYAVAGRRSEALAVVAHLSDLWRERYFSPYRLAMIYAGLEDEARMFEWLEVAYESRDANLIWLKVTPMLDSFRARPQLQDLMLRVGFQQCC